MPQPIRCYHYHEYDRKGRPVVSVCIAKTKAPNGRIIYSRGIAICSPLDYGRLKNKEGKRIARERAITAMHIRSHLLPMNAFGGRQHSCFQVLDSGQDAEMAVICSRWHKCAYSVMLSIKESELIRNVDDRIAQRKAEREAKCGPLYSTYDAERDGTITQRPVQAHFMSELREPNQCIPSSGYTPDDEDENAANSYEG